MAFIGAIPTGWPLVIDPAVTAPAVGNSFCFQPDPAGNDFSASFQATGTLTGLSSDLQISEDGGATFVNAAGGAAFLTAAAPTKVLTPAVAGALYRFNHTASTGNSVIRVTSN